MQAPHWCMKPHVQIPAVKWKVCERGQWCNIPFITALHDLGRNVSVVVFVPCDIQQSNHRISNIQHASLTFILLFETFFFCWFIFIFFLRFLNFICHCHAVKRIHQYNLRTGFVYVKKTDKMLQCVQQHLFPSVLTVGPPGAKKRHRPLLLIKTIKLLHLLIFVLLLSLCS